MLRYRQVAAYILAGGASSRMQKDKGLLDFGGVPLIVRTARLLEPLVTGITLVGAPRRYAALGLRSIADKFDAEEESSQPGRGPLAGIATALAATRWPWNLILACDLPYLSAVWLDWLLSRAIRSRKQIIIPRTAGGLEPLAAVYRRECGAPIAAALARGVRKVSDAIEGLRLELVYPREWSRLDPSGLVLKNMNTPADYRQARNWQRRNQLGATQVVASQRPEKRKTRSPLLDAK